MKGLIEEVAIPGSEKGTCKMAAGASVVYLALYDTQAERSIAFLFVAALAMG